MCRSLVRTTKHQSVSTVQLRDLQDGKILHTGKFYTYYEKGTVAVFGQNKSDSRHPQSELTS